MSEENVEIVRRTIEANRSDAAAEFDLVLSAIDPDFELVSSMGAVDQRVYHGEEGLRQYRRDMDEAWSEWRIEVEEVFEPKLGTVVAVIRPHLVARQSGIVLAEQRAVIYELTDGRICSVRGFPSRAEALEAVGLSE
jgi:ketosteroid isomerase-like protein